MFLSQVKEALGLPLVPADPLAGPSQVPPIPVPVPGPPVAGPSRALPIPVPASGPPPIVLEDSDSDNDVQTLAVPFRSGSSEAYLPMVSTDDS